MAIRVSRTLSLSDKFYWARRNWSAALAWAVLCVPYIVTRIVVGIWEVFRMLFVTDGSEILSYPWQQKWIGEEE